MKNKGKFHKIRKTINTTKDRESIILKFAMKWHSARQHTISHSFCSIFRYSCRYVWCSCRQAWKTISLLTKTINANTFQLEYQPMQWRSQLERSPRMWMIGCSNPGLDSPKSLKQLLNARQHIFSLKWRRHHCRWRVLNFDLCSALMAIEHWWFLSVQHLLWHVYMSSSRIRAFTPQIGRISLNKQTND